MDSRSRVVPCGCWHECCLPSAAPSPAGTGCGPLGSTEPSGTASSGTRASSWASACLWRVPRRCGASSSWPRTRRAEPCPPALAPGALLDAQAGLRGWVSALVWPGAFSKLKLFIIIMRIIIGFSRLVLLFSVCFVGKKSVCF